MIVCVWAILAFQEDHVREEREGERRPDDGENSWLPTVCCYWSACKKEEEKETR